MLSMHALSNLHWQRKLHAISETHISVSVIRKDISAWLRYK